MTVPQQLRDRVSALSSPDDLAQPAMTWRPASWRNRLSRERDARASLDYPGLIDELASATTPGTGDGQHRIGRIDVAQFASSEGLRPGDGELVTDAVVRAFIAPMIWGYGLVGYGPYRTERVLFRGGDAPDKVAIGQLRDVAAVALSQGGTAAFKHIADQRRTNRAYLKYLGPAFGTKFIYFLTKASPADTTPVMDSVVTGWVQRNVPDAGTFNLSWWDSGSYERYVGLMNDWASDLPSSSAHAWAADDVELLIFQDARGVAIPESENVTAESMLDDLGAETDARGGNVDKVGVLLVEALREWFALTLSPDQ
ncbi:hypothetical protein [Brachybacterium alimentarium]|uniref:8-oxoguanine DNA glycosylase OGG fold protein n=1 Tax=Brachybacterium alimentarium TaxID=47845 RepID=UPI0011C06481|nr:hypothetical protein [Brachybacterium alimentarium]